MVLKRVGVPKWIVCDPSLFALFDAHFLSQRPGRRGRGGRKEDGGGSSCCFGPGTGTGNIMELDQNKKIIIVA